MEIKDVIKKARKKKGLTQRKLAELLEIPYQQVQFWEYGKYKPSLSNISKLCDILDLKLDDIISKKVD